MLKEERLDFILQKLKANQIVKLSDLSESLQVSEDTIRRDIQTLDRNGLCMKVRGGAVPHSPNIKAHAFKDRVNASENQKFVIAQKALQLIPPGATILLDGGTTTFKLAGLLPANMLTVITNSIPVVNALIENQSVEVILAGGRIFKSSQVTTGIEAMRLMEKVRVDICFMGICSLHAELGVTAPNFDEAEVKRTMIQAANKVVAITTHDKIGTAESFKVCDIKSVDTIITEISSKDASFLPYKEMGIHIL